MNAVDQENVTALHLAAAQGHHDVARILVSQGAIVDAKDENRYGILCRILFKDQNFLDVGKFAFEKLKLRAVVVAQLVKRSLQHQRSAVRIHSSAYFYLEHSFTDCQLYWEDENK